MHVFFFCFVVINLLENKQRNCRYDGLNAFQIYTERVVAQVNWFYDTYLFMSKKRKQAKKRVDYRWDAPKNNAKMTDHTMNI